jgi:hypothetical protein
MSPAGDAMAARAGGIFLEDAARYAAGVATLEQVAEWNGIAPEEVLAALSDPDTAAQVDKRAAQLDRDGSVMRLRAKSVIEAALARLAEPSSMAEYPPSTLLRIVEVVSKLAVDPRDQPKESTGPSFMISIDLGDGQNISLCTGNTPQQIEPLTLDADTGVPVVSMTGKGQR